MLRRVALVRTDVSEGLSAANVVLSSPIQVTMMIEALRSPETSVLTRATRRNIPEDATCQRFIFVRCSVADILKCNESAILKKKATGA
jgi:hypothetical protein